MTESDAPTERGVRPAIDRKRNRGHAAAGGRILVAGIGTAATVTLAAFMSRAETAVDQPMPSVAELPAVAAPAPTTAPRTVIQVVVVRRRAPGEAGAPTPAAVGRAAPSVTAPRPAPAPAPSVAPPVARSHAS